MNRDNSNHRAVSISEAARMLGVHPNTIRRMCKRGQLPSFQLPARGDRRIPRDSLEAITRPQGAAR